MNRISTHILDLMRGTPAKGVPVRLERQDASGSWQLLNSSHTHTGPLIGNDLNLILEMTPEQQRRVQEYAAKLIEDLVMLVGAAMSTFAEPPWLSTAYSAAPPSLVGAAKTTRDPLGEIVAPSIDIGPSVTCFSDPSA